MDTNAEREPQSNDLLSVAPVANQKFTPEKIAERLQQFESWQQLLREGHSSSGRNGRPWRQWIHGDHGF